MTTKSLEADYQVHETDISTKKSTKITAIHVSSAKIYIPLINLEK